MPVARWLFLLRMLTMKNTKKRSAALALGREQRRHHRFERRQAAGYVH